MHYWSRMKISISTLWSRMVNLLFSRWCAIRISSMQSWLFSIGSRLYRSTQMNTPKLCSSSRIISSSRRLCMKMQLLLNSLLREELPNWTISICYLKHAARIYIRWSLFANKSSHSCSKSRAFINHKWLNQCQVLDMSWDLRSTIWICLVRLSF